MFRRVTVSLWVIVHFLSDCCSVNFSLIESGCDIVRERVGLGRRAEYVPGCRGGGTVRFRMNKHEVPVRVHVSVPRKNGFHHCGNRN